MYSEYFYKTIKAINDNSQLNRSFISTRQASRVFNVISTNIKNLNTFYTYYDDVTYHPHLDNHQKIPCCKKLRVFDTSKNDERIRGELLDKFGKIFPNGNAFPRVMFVTLLLLNSQYNLHSGSEYLYNILPENLINEFDKHLGLFLKETTSTITNPIMGIFALYSNEEALFSYIDMFNNESDNDNFRDTATRAETDFPCIRKRISNCQRSTFPVEAVVFSMYSMFAQGKYIGLSYDEIIDSIVSAYSEKISAIGKDNINSGAIFKVNDSDIDKINDFFKSLNTSEQTEILNCLGVSIKKSGEKAAKSNTTKSPRKPNKTYLNRGGRDEYRTCKSRKGQADFRKALLNQDGESCAIPGCKICGDEHVIASHIVEWSRANNLEKTDPNNGLVLCPNHDHLFDSHLISFDNTGKIMISSKLSSEDMEAFSINSNIRLDISPERELYMKRHRKDIK